jgi:beta-ureidopropionase / N-carbamoyl-L-amino-acid hydrolase
MNARVSDYVNGERLWHRLMDLARFGATPNGGVSRLALSDEEIAARAELVGWARAIGLSSSVDDASNLFLRLPGIQPDLPPLLVGSHTDTQPTGGKFDGAYGVVAAIEAAQAILASGRSLKRPIEVVAWMNEEGARFAPGMMGSAAFTGKRRMADIEAVVDRAGRSVRQELDKLLATERDLTRRPLGFPVVGYIEAHIEQGPRLERDSIPIGVATGIQGKRTFRVEVYGEESHAGTTPRAARRDALAAAAAMVRALHEVMADPADEVRLTIGMFTVRPNAPSVVPGEVVFSIDLRHHDAETVERLGDLVAPTCEQRRGPCRVEVHQLLYDPPLTFPKQLRARLLAAAARLGANAVEMPSPAGHDARYLHYVCPAAMLFIPCKGGVSHHPSESITPEHAAIGARVLTEAIFDLASE